MSRVQSLRLAVCVLVASLMPAAACSAGVCDSAGRELDNIAAQIAELVRPCEMPNNPCGGKQNCEDTRVPPCGKEEYKAIADKMKPLIERGNELSQRCFGVPFSGPAPAIPPTAGGAQ